MLIIGHDITYVDKFVQCEILVSKYHHEEFCQRIYPHHRSYLYAV